MNNNRIEIDAGVQHVVIRNNYVEATDTTGISVNTRTTLTWLSNELPASPIPLPPVTITKTSTDVMVLNTMDCLNPDMGDGTHPGVGEKWFSALQRDGSTTNATTTSGTLIKIALVPDDAKIAFASVRCVMSRNDLSNFVNGGISNNDAG